MNELENLYKYFPFELLFAIINSVKYIYFIYIAKWISGKNLTIIIGVVYIFLGMLSWFEFLYPEDPYEENQLKGNIHAISGCFVICLAIAQYKYSTFDPLDSNLIIND